MINSILLETSSRLSEDACFFDVEMICLIFLYSDYDFSILEV